MSIQAPNPKPRHPIYRLPIDLILMIIDRLTPEEFINFAFANYPLLLHYGLAPAMSARQLAHLIDRSSLPSIFRLIPLPTELLLQTMRKLSPIDLMRFVMANYSDLVSRGLAPQLTDETIKALACAS